MMTFTQNAFILLVGDDAALLLLPQGLQKASPVLTRSNSEEDAKPVLEMLALAPHLPVYLLADVQAQDYKIETLPPVSMMDQAKLLARKREQAFPNASLSQAQMRAKRSALFIHLDDQGPVGQWLDRLEALPNPSGAVSLLPMESAALIDRFMPAAAKGWGLLLSAQKTGGFRQIITRNGDLLFTRLTPPIPQGTHADHIAQTLGQDIKATRAYLSRMGLEDATPLHLAAILPSPLHQAFHAIKKPVASEILFTPREAAARLNLTMPPQPDEPSADMVHALWFRTQKNKRTHLIRPHEKHKQTTQKILNFGNRLAIGLCVLALLITIGTGHTLWQGTARITAKQEQLSSLEAKLSQSRERLAKDSAPLDHLRKAIERRRLFTQPRKGPEKLFAQLAAALGDEARLLKIEWTSTETHFDLLLADDGSRRSFNELTKQKITRSIDNIAFLLRGALEGYQVNVTKYPFPNLPNETITNKASSGAQTLPIASLVIRAEDQK